MNARDIFEMGNYVLAYHLDPRDPVIAEAYKKYRKELKDRAREKDSMHIAYAITNLANLGWALVDADMWEDEHNVRIYTRTNVLIRWHITRDIYIKPLDNLYYDFVNIDYDEICDLLITDSLQVSKCSIRAAEIRLATRDREARKTEEIDSLEIIVDP